MSNRRLQGFVQRRTFEPSSGRQDQVRVKARLDEHDGPVDSDTIDRWLVEFASTPIENVVAGPINPVVYYVRFDQMVKIGTTSQLSARMAAIPHDELLATEPGSYDLEKQRHREFEALRHKPRGEWFRYESPLVEHIAALQAGSP